VDLLIICGDFQAVRNLVDLECMACPPKYRQMGDFYQYWKGEKQAPVPTLFIGGNHEASNHLAGLYHGGWAAPNIYFMGYSGVVKFGGLRIGGISGLYNEREYDLGHYERPPYDHSAMRSIYHYRRMETFKLAQLQSPLDIFISHEWPTGIYHYGDTAALLRTKPYFKDEINKNILGAKPLEDLLFKLQPARWFSAHLHVHFEAQVPHPQLNGPTRVTQFMALDKCLPRRTFLRIIDVPDKTGQPKKLSYDPEWLGIVKAADPFMNMARTRTRLPERLNVAEIVLPDLTIPANFKDCLDVPSNPQTDAFCKLLGIANRFSSRPAAPIAAPNPDEIDLDL